MLRLLALACVCAVARAHTEAIASIDAGEDTITLAAADPGTFVGTEVTLEDATGQTCASKVGATTPLVVTAIDGAVLSFAADSIDNSDDDAATNCVLTRDVSPAPGAVDGAKIYFTNVDEKSFKVTWEAPSSKGDYNADIVGYDIEIAAVCELTEAEKEVYANRVGTHIPADWTNTLQNHASLGVAQPDAYAAAIYTGLSATTTDEHGVSGGALATGDELLADDSSRAPGGNREISNWPPLSGSDSGDTRELGPWAQTRKVSYMSHVTIPGSAVAGSGAIVEARASYTDATGSHSLYETALNTNMGWGDDELYASPMMEETAACIDQALLAADTVGSYSLRAAESACVMQGVANDESLLVVDTVSGKTLARTLSSNTATSACSTSWAATDPVGTLSGTQTPAAGQDRTKWSTVTGVYTPGGGQDFSKSCLDACATGTCGAGTLTDPVEQCGACYPRDPVTEADISDSLTAAGCFPGATGFPTASDTSHTLNLPGAATGSYYVVRVRAYNEFGQGPYGTQSYAVQLATEPTKPLDLAMGTTAADAAYSPSPTGVTLTWAEPDNFATGTDDCAGASLTELQAGSVTAKHLRCSAKSPAEIAVDCGLSAPYDDADAAACLVGGTYYDCAYDTATDVISPFACTTNGYGAGTVGAAKCTAASTALTTCTAISSPTSQADCAAGGMHCVFDADATACTAGQAFCDAHSTGLSAGDSSSSLCTYSAASTEKCVPTQSYTVYQDAVKIAENIASPTYAVTGLTAGTSYAFTVTMTNVVGEGPVSDALTVKTPEVPAAPAAPRVVEVISAEDGVGSQVKLDWLDALDTVVTKTDITGYRLWAQSKDGFTYATAEDCTAIDPTNGAHVTTCNGVTLDGNAATCTGAGTGAECEYTPERAAGSTTWQPAARVYDLDFDSTSAPVSLTIDFEDDDIVADQTAVITVPVDGAVSALEISTVTETATDSTTYGAVVSKATVSNLRTATEYRFAIQFVSAAGDGAVSAFTSAVTTLEEPISDLRIMSGPPCVFETPASTTFAAASAGTGVQYSWELVFNPGKGNGALNNDDTAGANDYNGICVPTDATLCADMTTEGICDSASDASDPDRAGINPGACTWDSANNVCEATDKTACTATGAQVGRTECEAAGRCTFHDALSAGDTPDVMSGSIIAGPGSANCKNSACSVMEYTIPLPGFDDAVPDYDEMEIRVIAYNKRGMVRESVAFGWTPRTGGTVHTEDYQTIEYCGCTEPSAKNYWQLATYSLPATCDGVEEWNNAHSSAGHMLSTVLKDEFEYYQFHYDHTATEVEVTVRMDEGTVDVYIGNGGVATPGATSTYSVEKLGVNNYYVTTIPYWQLQGSSSLYITVKGAGTGAFAHYKVMAKANTFRSFSCDTGATDPHCEGGEDDSGTGETTIYRAVLTEGSLVSGKVVPTYYYHFYEFAYPRASNDIDVELEVACSVGEVELFASKTERYPSDERAVDLNNDGTLDTAAADNPGYWTGTSHTGVIAAGATTKFMYTLKPQAHADTVSSGHGGLLYFSVKGTADHSAGSFLPSSTYSIKAKVYRYRVESELLDLVGGLAEERRYSVVTLDNFNYYEVRLTPSTSAVTINLEVHYGEVSLYYSKSTLPTQDSSAAADGGGADGAWGGASWGTTAADIDTGAGAQTITIPSTGLNLVDGYVYFGLIGRTAECSYDLSVELTQLNAAAEPTALYNCGSGIVSTSPTCLDGGGAALTASSFGTTDLTAGTTYFYKYHISEDENVDMSVTERSGAGTPVSASDRGTTAQDTWGADWTEGLVSTWVDDFSDELNLDVDVEITVPSDATVYVSASDPYPSSERATPNPFNLASPSSLVGTFEDVGTFSRTWLYFSITPSGSNLATASIRVAPTENVPDDPTTYTTPDAVCETETCVPLDPADAAVCSAVTLHSTGNRDLAGTAAACTSAGGGSKCVYTADSCTNHGSCIYDPVEGESTDPYCVCDDGWYDGPAVGLDSPSGKCSVAAAASGGSVALSATFRDPDSTKFAAGTMSGVLSLQADNGHATKENYYAGHAIVTVDPAGTGIIDTSSATVDGAAVLTVTWDSAITTTTSTTYTISSTVCADTTAACTIDEAVPDLEDAPDAAGKVSALYDSRTEAVPLDCRVDDCKPSGTAGKVGYVSCTNANTQCTVLVPQPMMTVSMAVTAAPAYSKIRAYMNGKPYPRAGANTFVNAAAGDYTTDLKVFSLPPSSKEHTLNLVLTTDSGEPLAISTRSFIVDYQGGCGVNGACSNQGVCHSGYCVCFDGYYGAACENNVDPATASFSPVASFGASTAYRLRQDALNAEKLASTRFVHKIHLEETTTALAREQAAMTAKNTEITSALEDGVLKLDSDLNLELQASQAAVETSVNSVYSKQERNTIKIQQAKQEAARLKTANREAYIDQKRALFAHATAVQNANDAALLVAQQKIAEKNQAIEDNFREGRFIKNQLRTANGPRTEVSDLKTQSCTTDQFFNTKCTDVDYDDAAFAAGARTDAIRTEAAAVDTAIFAERQSNVPR